MMGTLCLTSPTAIDVLVFFLKLKLGRHCNNKKNCTVGQDGISAFIVINIIDTWLSNITCLSNQSVNAGV